MSRRGGPSVLEVLLTRHRSKASHPATDQNGSLSQEHALGVDVTVPRSQTNTSEPATLRTDVTPGKGERTPSVNDFQTPARSPTPELERDIVVAVSRSNSSPARTSSVSGTHSVQHVEAQTATQSRATAQAHDRNNVIAADLAAELCELQNMLNDLRLYGARRTVSQRAFFPKGRHQRPRFWAWWEKIVLKPNEGGSTSHRSRGSGS